MKDHELILKLIEEVDPADTARLDDIDEKVRFFIDGFKRPHPEIIGESAYIIHTYGWDEYTRSRDALKAIRPKGWEIQIQSFGKKSDCWSCYITKKTDTFTTEKHLQSHLDAHQTEELAELHAIIQAIAYERSQK